MSCLKASLFIPHNWRKPILELLYPTWGETKSYKYIREGYPSFLLGPNLNLSGYVVNIEEESEVYRTPAPKTVHILYTTIIFM